MPKSALPRVGIIYGPEGAANLREIYRAAHGICHVVIIFQPKVADSHPALLAAASRMFETCRWLPDEGLAELRLDGLTTFHDTELDIVDQALYELDLPGRSIVDRPWDKFVQRTTLNSAGTSLVPVTMVDSADDLIRAADDLGLPLVVKPRRGVGGAGIAMVRTSADLDHTIRNRGSWRRLLAESMLPEGRHPRDSGWLSALVSVETENSGRGRRHVAIFDKCPVTVIKKAAADGGDAVRVTGDVTPSRLPDNARRAVLDKTSAALAALGVRWRVTHTELWVSGDDVEIVEVNGRVGGHLNRLLSIIGGPDLVRSALWLATGREPPAHPSTPVGHAAGLFPTFLTAQPRVQSNVSRRDLRAIPGVVGVDEVARYGTARSATSFRAANVTVRADTQDELDEAVRGAHQQIGELFAPDGAISDPWRADVRS